MIEEISIDPGEIRQLGAKILEAIMDEMPDLMEVRDILVTVESLDQLSQMFRRQLKDKGVEVGFRREEMLS